MQKVQHINLILKEYDIIFFYVNEVQSTLLLYVLGVFSPSLPLQCLYLSIKTLRSHTIPERLRVGSRLVPLLYRISRPKTRIHLLQDNSIRLVWKIGRTSRYEEKLFSHRMHHTMEPFHVDRVGM